MRLDVLVCSRSGKKGRFDIEMGWKREKEWDVFIIYFDIDILIFRICCYVVV